MVKTQNLNNLRRWVCPERYDQSGSLPRNHQRFRERTFIAKLDKPWVIRQAPNSYPVSSAVSSQSYLRQFFACVPIPVVSYCFCQALSRRDMVVFLYVVTTKLSKGFDSLSSLAALLEVHPTFPNSKALRFIPSSLNSTSQKHKLPRCCIHRWPFRKRVLSLRVLFPSRPSSTLSLIATMAVKTVVHILDRAPAVKCPFLISSRQKDLTVSWFASWRRRWRRFGPNHDEDGSIAATNPIP